MNSQVKNAADPTQVKKAGDKDKRGRERELNDVRLVLSSPQGRRFLFRYLETCDRISAEHSGSWTYFKEGERNIALKIKADIVEADPEALLTMMLENKKERESNV